MITLRTLAERFGWRDANRCAQVDDGVAVSRLRLPGLELAGHFAGFPAGTALLFGASELDFLDRLDPALAALRLDDLLTGQVPGVVVCDGRPLAGALDAAVARMSLPAYLAATPAESLWHEAAALLEESSAPVKSIPGTMLEVYGLGILLLGEAGIGKSECALELVKRGHRLVSDDVVTLRRGRGGAIVAFSDELIRHHMEIRGLGIVDVRALFGIGAVLESKPVDAVIQLRKTRESSEFERIGVVQQHYRVFDLSVPKLVIPVKAGRNISIQVEVAALNEKLKKQGMHSARNFLDSLYNSLQGNQPGA